MSEIANARVVVTDYLSSAINFAKAHAKRFGLEHGQSNFVIIGLADHSGRPQSDPVHAPAAPRLTDLRIEMTMPLDEALSRRPHRLTRTCDMSAVRQATEVVFDVSIGLGEQWRNHLRFRRLNPHAVARFVYRDFDSDDLILTSDAFYPLVAKELTAAYLRYNLDSACKPVYEESRKSISGSLDFSPKTTLCLLWIMRLYADNPNLSMTLLDPVAHLQGHAYWETFMGLCGFVEIGEYGTYRGQPSRDMRDLLSLLPDELNPRDFGERFERWAVADPYAPNVEKDAFLMSYIATWKAWYSVRAAGIAAVGQPHGARP